MPSQTEPVSPPLIDFRGLSLRRSGRTILDAVDWTVNPGEHWAVIGANGSGKTTLLRVAAGVLFPSGGSAAVLGCRFGQTDLAALRRRIGWVSSAMLEYLPPAATAGEIVAAGLTGAFRPPRESGGGELERARVLLEQAGLAGRADAAFAVLSAGERQKVLLARALAAEPEILVLDEAVAGLDLPAREGVLAAIGRVAAAGRGVVMVTHHIEEIPPAVTHGLVLRSGRVLAAGPIGMILTGRVMSRAFGMALCVRRVGARYAALPQAAEAAEGQAAEGRFD